MKKIRATKLKKNRRRKKFNECNEYKRSDRNDDDFLRVNAYKAKTITVSKNLKEDTHKKSSKQFDWHRRSLYSILMATFLFYFHIHTERDRNYYY